MEETQTPQEPVAAVEEPVEQPATEGQPAPETPVQSEVSIEAPAEPQVETPQEVDPKKDFLDAYKALCQEKGYEITFEARPLFDGISYDFSKVTVVYDVAKLK